MKQKLSLYLLKAAVFIPNLFPRFFLKILPPLIRFMLEDAIKYRKKVVYSNLRRCFPENEVKGIAKQYYKHLSRVIVEPLLTKGLSKNFLGSKVVSGDQVLEHLHAQGKNVFIVMGHMGNWEWLSAVAAFKSDYDSTCVYKKMSNPFIEKWVNESRAKYGTGLVEMRSVPRVAMEKARMGKPYILSFIADQIPSHDNCAVVDFFGAPMYFFDGYEKLARKFKATLVYFESVINDGVYTYNTKIINDFEVNPNYDKTIQEFASLLEENIKKQPYNWLWSHKRWKRVPS